jgi:hypothetical protein
VSNLGFITAGLKGSRACVVVDETYLKINFGLGPNAYRAGPGENVKFRPVQTFALGVISHGI